MIRMEQLQLKVNRFILVVLFLYIIQLQYTIINLKYKRGGKAKNCTESPSFKNISLHGQNTLSVSYSCKEDPLQDGCPFELTGYPKEPLTIKTARLCDTRLQTQLDLSLHELFCGSDPTCKRCRLRQIAKVSYLYKAWTEGSRNGKRMQRFRAAFQIEKPVIVCTLNYGQLFLFLNWANSCVANRVLDPRKNVLVIPTNNVTRDILNSFGFQVEPTEWLDLLPFTINQNYTGTPNSGDHSLLNTVTVFAANLLIKLDFTVLIMDVDMVFIKDVFPLLKSASRGKDILGMYSPRADAFGFINSGFLYVMPTKKSKVLMQTIENLMYIKVKSDQIIWNAVLRHFRFQQLNQRILPMEYFYTLWTRLDPSKGYNATLVKCIHAVSSNKAERLVKYGYWYMNESYPFYSNEVIKDAENRGLLPQV